jgi:hypothetical protein
VSSVVESLADLASQGSVSLHEPADLFSDAMLGVPLPADHVRVLGRSNGLEAYGGYFRLFGLGGVAAIELRRWNEPGLWRHAWNGAGDGFLFFGETAWGDQYAYLQSDPGAGVYRLDAFSMEPELLAGSFDEFMRVVFLPNARRPADELTVATRGRLGRIPPAEHVAFLDHPTGRPDAGEVVRMPAVAAMLANARVRVGNVAGESRAAARL